MLVWSGGVGEKEDVVDGGRWMTGGVRKGGIPGSSKKGK